MMLRHEWGSRSWKKAEGKNQGTYALWDASILGRVPATTAYQLRRSQMFCAAAGFLCISVEGRWNQSANWIYRAQQAHEK
jgi:hypothetical protein